MEIRIDPGFRALVPPLSAEELEQLEENIVADGCRDPLVLWQGAIVDGHNRYAICSRHRIPFKTVETDFASRSHAEEWIIRNQFGRRNLMPYVRTKLALRLEETIAARAKGRQATSTGGTTPQLKQISAEAGRIETRKEIAKVAGVSHDTVAKVKKIEQKATPEVRAKLETGEMSINQAHKEVTKKEKKEERAIVIEEQKKAIEDGTVALPPGVFEVVVMDPPWNYGREYDPETSRVANPYPEMSQAQLLAMLPPFADDCVLFLWTTQAFLWSAKELLDKWGFMYKATMVWDKDMIGMGAWLRMQCEFCLVAIKGKPAWNNTKHRDIVRERRREHSRKPEAFYEIVEDITIGRRLDYFSRESRPGWASFGNDTGKF